MAFVKLDCKILDSTIWLDRPARELFITALLMAKPFELLKPTPQLHVNSLETTGYTVPAGWYGLIEAAGPGIVNRAGMDMQLGLAALERLGAPEPQTSSCGFDGRRLARVDGATWL